MGMLDGDLAARLKRLAISTSRFAKMVGISQPAMRLIVMGANKASKKTQQKIDAVLSHIEYCDKCGRAFLEEEDDDDSETETKAEETKKKK